MSNRKKKRREKKISRKIVHYIQLRTHRQWPNPLNYTSHLEVHNSIAKPIIYEIDHHLNKKWILIRQSQITNQFNQIYQDEIKNYFLHQIDLIDHKYFCLNNQFDENNKFIQEIFLRSIEITDHLLYLYQQIENSDYYIYEYRLNILKYEFKQEQESLKHLFINQHLNEFNNQIVILNIIEQEDVLKQFIEFKYDKQRLKENFVKDITMLNVNFKTQIELLRSTMNKIIHSNKQQIDGIAKRCDYLNEKTRKAKERINQEITSIIILRKRIKETKLLIEQTDTNNNHINDKLNQLKQCSYYHQNQLIWKKTFSNISQQSRVENPLRHLSVVIDNNKKRCQKKLLKAERILLLINRCRQLEFEDENLLLTISQIDFNQINNKIISQVHYLQNCRFEFDSFFDELSLFWKRFAHVQMDIYIRIHEKNSLKNSQNVFKQQLKIFI
ncbi:unnamed protein product [Rotaria magnacalcarata]|uniref:Uncharacterized protein n=1 Tax=Rotaria magnacalcarata TaxID=392030 RepID=A0A816E2X5_9BILA|nr:unnamed protein product [Rotaria magnacalcarata]CAF1641481.1 unnamed protein product [Rotaria magnacalcarata]CAF1925483.1 unnamed protein product [Rotaria magnacalcarata]CAF3837243.1 unnamed protein product [Rotaria magnacalcarata]